MTRRIVLAAAALALMLGGCSGKESAQAEQGRPLASGKGGHEEGHTTLHGYRTDFDMLDSVHLADVDHQGLYIDFGTPARMKYTIGHWRTDWGSDGHSGDATYTYAGARGWVYFDVDHPGPLTIRMRLRPLGTSVVSPYLNGKPIDMVSLKEGTGFRDYDIAVPADLVKKGENQLMLVFGGTTKVGNEAVSVAMESMRIVNGTIPKGRYEPPSYGSLVSDVDVGGVRRHAIAVHAPTTLTYYVQVPARGKLAFGVGEEGSGQAHATVKVTPTKGAPKQIFDQSVGGKWSDHVVDLGAWANQVVRIDLTADGESRGRVAWSDPVVVMPNPKATATKQAKNVVVLLIDTLRADKLRPFNPKTRVKTPALDEVADQGTIFEHAQAPENWTKPSVASILTSLHPETHRTKTDSAVLPSTALMVSEQYHKHGFQTAMFSANGYVSRKFGFDQGFDYYTNYIRENKSTAAEHVFHDAGNWIEKHKGKRFFVYIQTIDPHVPYDPPEQYLKMYDDSDYHGQVKPRETPQLLEKAKHTPPLVELTDADKRRIKALHDGEITYHDVQLGKFIDKMKKLGLWNDTLFVIVADHGEEFDDHGKWGHGHSTYQELLHVPLIFRFPGAVPKGKRVARAVSTIDLAPTVLALSGVPPMTTAEGRSLVGYFDGRPPTGPDVAFSDFLDDQRVIFTGRWKMVLRGLNTDFYDLVQDPGEHDDLDTNHDLVAERYCRIMIGQFLGSTDRRHWLDAKQGPGIQLRAENATMDQTTKDQLEALGYAQ